MLQKFKLFDKPLTAIKKSKVLINTINAHSYNVTQTDAVYEEALMNSDVLIPDGISVVWAVNWLICLQLKKIAGADLFYYEMELLQKTDGKCFFLGSTETNLKKIKERASQEYPNVAVQTYSPPYKPEFSEEDNIAIREVVNAFQPDVLFIGMTAPKQEKWAYQHFKQLQVGHVCCIGAVFDFYAGTVSRAPRWMIKIGLEWFYRLIKEPRRMWRRYLVGNTKFIWAVIKEKYRMSSRKNQRNSSPSLDISSQ